MRTTNFSVYVQRSGRCYCLSLFVLLFSLHYLPGQSSWSFVDDYSRAHMWEEMFIEPICNGSPLPSFGNIEITSSAVQFNDCGNNSDKRVYRKIGAPLSDSWVLDFDFTPVAGGPHGVAHVIAGLTGGTENPYNIVPASVGSSPHTYAHTDQDGIFVEYLSPHAGSPSTYYIRLRVKDGTSYETASTTLFMSPDGQTYYFRLERQSAGNFRLQLYNNVARTGSPSEINHSSSLSVTGLNVIQHSNIPQGSYNRRLTGTIENLMLYDASLPCVKCPDYALILSDENYISAKSMRVAVQSEAAVHALNNTREAWQEIAYFDGLGRPLQEVSVDGGSGGGDLIQYHQYDAFGREAVVDLPYTSSSNDGSLREDIGGGLPVNLQRGFYSSEFPHLPTADQLTPFAETSFETSPLNRVIEQGAAGDDWQVGNGHSIRSSYRLNTSNEVFFFGSDPQAGQSYTSSYAADELTVVETQDENDHRSWAFADKLGRVILEQRELSGADARTYYLYDEWGRVRYILQPQGVAKFESSSYGGSKKLSQSLLDDFAFQYVYDGRGRVIEKKVPGADWVHLVYDPLDRVVLSQDGNQRAAGEWSFTKYDGLSRPVMTGTYANANSRANRQQLIDQQSLWHEERDGSNFATQYGYSNQALPTSSLTIHSVTYYDDYDFDRNGSPDPAYGYVADPEHFSSHAPTTRTRGLITSMLLAILTPDDDMPDWLRTTTYYDEEQREIQIIAENHLHGHDITWYEYDFVGQLLFSKHEHLGHDGTTKYGAYRRGATLYKSYTYDPRGRLIRTEQKTEDPENVNHATEFVTLSEQHYDPLGQMSEKHLHYRSGDQALQLGNYSYNIRGWLTQFNAPSTSPPSGSYQDLFSMILFYNEGASGMVSGTEDQYNGNISGMSWQVLGEGNEIRSYGFAYDELSRLTAANYRELSPQNQAVNTNRYTVNNLSYDLNGNILSLKRKGKTGAGANAFGTMDNLDYSYSGNQLIGVSDAGLSSYLTAVEQFVDGNSSGNEYSYDLNGNMLTDKNKGIDSDITYNILNKPTKVSTASNNLLYIYSADGTKLRQRIFDTENGENTKVTDYLGPFQYEDPDGDGSGAKEMIFFSHEEGRVRRDGNSLIYEMFLRDHLGNNRIMFADLDGDGEVDPTMEVLQETHFYPFGLSFSGANTITAPAAPNQYLFTGKETQDELDLGWIDFGARMYDASVGRWNGIDALAEERDWLTPYNHVQNNPIVRIDPDGNLDDYFIYEDGTIEYIDTGDEDNYFYVRDNEAFFLASFERNEHGLVYLPAELSVSYCNDECHNNENGVEFIVRQKPGGAADEMWLRPDAMASLLGAAVELNTTEMVVNHFSNSDGSSPAPSVSHVQGKNGDIRYLRTDGDWSQAVWVQHEEFDKERNTHVANALKKYGWQDIKSYEYNDWIVPGTSHLNNHHHHFHLQGYSPQVKTVSRPSFFK